MAKSKTKNPTQGVTLATTATIYALTVAAGVGILMTSYQIRMMAINEFGPVIHEDDPYFNLRATEVSFMFQNPTSNSLFI
jgi:asparagine N-glycosylation enzyme membrane subunit Stt3